MAPVVSSVMCVLALAAVLRREEDPPGGLRSHGRSGRFTPFAPIAHSGPSHRFLRPRFAGTCLRRAPPPALVRGWTSHPGGSSSLRSTAAAALYCGFSVALPCLPLQVETQSVAGGKARGLDKTTVVLMSLIINVLAQLTGVFRIPVSCAKAFCISYFAATGYVYSANSLSLWPL